MFTPAQRSGLTLEAPESPTKLDLTGSFYGELYGVANNLMRKEGRDCSLQSTILAHDAYMARGQRNLQTCERPVLLAAAANFMRRRLVDNAQGSAAAKARR